MNRSRKKLPKDPNQLAAEIVRRSTEEADDLQNAKSSEPSRSPISEYLAEIGRKGGLKGGPARKATLSSKRRKEIAQKAAKIRWLKRKKH